MFSNKNFLSCNIVEFSERSFLKDFCVFRSVFMFFNLVFQKHFRVSEAVLCVPEHFHVLDVLENFSCFQNISMFQKYFFEFPETLPPYFLKIFPCFQEHFLKRFCVSCLFLYFRLTRNVSLFLYFFSYQKHYGIS